MASIGSAEFRLSANLTDLRKGLGAIPGLAKGAAAQLDRELSGGFAGAGQAADQLVAKLQTLAAKKLKIEATVEVKKVALNNIAQEIQNLEKQKIELAVNGAGAASAIAKIDRQLKELGAKKLVVEADIGAAKTNLNQVVGEIERLDNKLKESGNSAKGFGQLYQGVLQGIGQQLTQIAGKAAIAPFKAIASSVGDFKNLDAQLQKFAALSDQTRDSLAPLNDTIQELAITTSKTPDEIATAANTLLTLGAAAEDVEGQLPGVVKLSEATGSGLELSAEVVQTVGNIFGESSDDIADKLTVLQNVTSATAGDILQLASQAGSVGVGLGESFNGLASTFATLRDSGFTAETAATALKSSLIALSAPTDEQASAFKKLGIAAFDSQGNFKGLDAILPELQKSVAGLTEKDRSDLLKRAFGADALPAIVTLLGQLDGKLATTRGSMEEFEGTASKTVKQLNEGFSASVDLLQGSVKTIGTNFVAALEPAGTAGAVALGSIANEVLANEGLFDELTASAQGFSDTLKDNPENVNKISQAVVGVVSIVQSEIAGALDGLAAFLDDSEKVDGLADAIAATGDTLGLVSDILGALSPVIGIVAQNSELFGVALQLIAVRMIAIKAVGFASAIAAMVSQMTVVSGATSVAAGSFTRLGVSAGGAASGVGALGAASTIALAPLAALLVAVAAAQFIKLAGEVRLANKEIEAIGTGAYAASGGALQLGQKLKNFNEQLAAEKRGEIKLSDEQIARGTQLQKLAKEQLADVRSQLANAKEINAIKPQQKAEKATLIAQLEVSEKAVQNQIKAFDVSLEARVDPASVKQSIPAGETVDVAVDADTEPAETALAKFQTASAEAVAQVQKDSGARVQAVREAQLGGVKSEEEAAAAIAQIQAGSLADELAAKQAQLTELAGLTGSDEAETKAIGQEKLKLEGEISQLSLSVVEAEIAEKKRLRDKELEDLKRANAQAEAAIVQSQNSRIAAIRESQLGGLGEDEAAAQIRQVEQDGTRATIALKQQELAQVASLESQGVISATEATDQRIALNAELGRLNLERLDRELAAQKALEEAEKKAALEEIANTLGVRSSGLGTTIERDRGQLDLLGAQVELSKSLDAVENSRLQTQIAGAEAAGNSAEADRLRATLAQQQSQQFEKQAKLQLVQLGLQQKIQGVELERAKLEAEIALAEADANGESERVLALRRQQVQLADEAIARQGDINQAQVDGLTAQQAVTREQEKQAVLADEQNRKEQERARLLGIISGQLNVTDKEQAGEALQNAEDRFDLAAGAGLTSQGDRQQFGSALADVERLVDKDASDQQLLQEAIRQRDNDVFQQLLKDIGRGDIVELAELAPTATAAATDLRPVGLKPDEISQRFEGMQAKGGATGLDAVGQQIVQGLEAIKGLLAQNFARPYQLVVETGEDSGVVAAGVYAEQQKAALAALGG